MPLENMMPTRPSMQPPMMKGRNFLIAGAGTSTPRSSGGLTAISPGFRRGPRAAFGVNFFVVISLLRAFSGSGR